MLHVSRSYTNKSTNQSKSVLLVSSGILAAEWTVNTSSARSTPWCYSEESLWCTLPLLWFAWVFHFSMFYFKRKNVHLYIKIQLFPVQDVGLRPLMRCQVISFTCHYILSRLLSPLMQSTVVCVSIYMPLFYWRASADGSHCASWQVLLSFQNWAPSSHEIFPTKSIIFQPQNLAKQITG